MTRGRSGRVAPVVVAAAVLYAGFVLLRLAAYGWDPSAFVVAGDGTTDVAKAPDGLGVHRDTDGYDGQAYYRLSRAPLTDELDDHGIAFTRPAYWQTRIGYPATVWALALGGRAALVPAAMVALNLAAVVAIAAGAALLARDLGRSPWLGLVPAAWAGYVIGVGQDLTEPLAGALLVAALLALQRDRPGLAAAALTAAALTRETTLVLAAAIVLTGLVERVRGRSAGARPLPPWWVGALPLAAYAGWRTWVRARWAGAVPDPPGDSPLTAPLVELARYLARAAGDPEAQADNLVLLLPTLTVLALLAVGLTDRGPGSAHLRLALAAYLLLLACLPVWDRGQAYLRWACEPVVVGWVLLLGRPARRPRLLPVVAGVVAVSWLAAVALTHADPDPARWVPADARVDRP